MTKHGLSYTIRPILAKVLRNFKYVPTAHFSLSAPVEIVLCRAEFPEKFLHVLKLQFSSKFSNVPIFDRKPTRRTFLLNCSTCMTSHEKVSFTLSSTFLFVCLSQGAIVLRPCFSMMFHSLRRLDWVMVSSGLSCRARR